MEKYNKLVILTEKEEIIAWNYEENRHGSGYFFETPVKHQAGFDDSDKACRISLHS